MTPVAIRESPHSHYARYGQPLSPLRPTTSIVRSRSLRPTTSLPRSRSRRERGNLAPSPWRLAPNPYLQSPFVTAADYHTTTRFRYLIPFQSLHLDRGVGSITAVVSVQEWLLLCNSVTLSLCHSLFFFRFPVLPAFQPVPLATRHSSLATALFLDTPPSCCYVAMRMRPSVRKALFAILAVAVFGILIYRFRGAIQVKDFSWDRLASSVRHADVSLLLLSMLGILICLSIRALRWTRFSRYFPRATYSHIFTSTVIGFSSIFLLGRAAEPIRPLLIARKDDIPVSSEFGIYVLERMFDMASTVVLASMALLFVPRLASAREGNPLLAAARTMGIVLLIGLVLGISFLVYFRMHGAARLERRMDAWRARGVTGWRQRVAGLAGGFGQGLQAIRTFNDLFFAVAISALHWTLIAIVYYMVARSFGGRLAELGLFDAVLVLVFTMTGSTMQLPGVGGGSQIASFLAYSRILGVDNEPAAAASIVLWLITFAGPNVLGIPLLIREGWSMGDLRRMARAEKEAEAHGGHIAVKPDGSTGGETQQ
jgi:uncharacterized protein (TIRG00374 family)